MINFNYFKHSFISIFTILLIAVQINISQAAEISGTYTGSLTKDTDTDSGNRLTTSGYLNITDGDADEAAMVRKTMDGNFGSLSIFAVGNWRYSADNGQNAIQNLGSGEKLTDRFTVRSIDGTPQDIIITIFGIAEGLPTTNTPAVISGTYTGSLTEDTDTDSGNRLTTSGYLNITDGDAGEAAMVRKTMDGNFGSLTIFALGNWRYSADNGQNAIQNLGSGETLTDRFTVRSIDGTPQDIIITIFGIAEGVPTTNTPAVISGTYTGSLTEDTDADSGNRLTTSGYLNITDADAGEAEMVRKTMDGNFGSLTIFTFGNWRYSADNGQNAIQNLGNGETLTDRFTVHSIDGTPRDIIITIFSSDATNQTNDNNLTWTAPFQREDGSLISLAEIAGYKIYYGTRQGDYQNMIDINDQSVNSYPSDLFSKGTYYIVVTAYDNEGRESQYSAEIEITNLK